MADSPDPVPGDRGEPGALFVARPGGGDTGQRGVTILRGTTDQGQTFHINLDGDRATLIDTRLEGMCPNGRPWDLRWYPPTGTRSRSSRMATGCG